MKRSGGRAGRPFGHFPIQNLENQVSKAKSDATELTAILAELGHRNSRRAIALKDLVHRLLRSLKDEVRSVADSSESSSQEQAASLAISSSPCWCMEIEKADFVDAIGTARSKPTLRRVADGRGGFENDVILSGWDFGLSVRSSGSAMDIDGRGSWTSPIRVYGAGLRRLAPKLAPGKIVIQYAAGRLKLGGTEFDAYEV